MTARCMRCRRPLRKARTRTPRPAGLCWECARRAARLPAAVRRHVLSVAGTKGGRVGGRRSAEALTKDELSARGRAVARSRWSHVSEATRAFLAPGVSDEFRAALTRDERFVYDRRLAPLVHGGRRATLRELGECLGKTRQGVKHMEARVLKRLADQRLARGG